jgi:hypothetical protein
MMTQTEADTQATQPTTATTATTATTLDELLYQAKKPALDISRYDPHGDLKNRFQGAAHRYKR